MILQAIHVTALEFNELLQWPKFSLSVPCNEWRMRKILVSLSIYIALRTIYLSEKRSWQDFTIICALWISQPNITYHLSTICILFKTNIVTAYRTLINITLCLYGKQSEIGKGRRFHGLSPHALPFKCVSYSIESKAHSISPVHLE